MHNIELNLEGSNIPALFGITEDRSNELMTQAKELLKASADNRTTMSSKDIISICLSVSATPAEAAMCMYYAGIDNEKAVRATLIAQAFGCC